MEALHVGEGVAVLATQIVEQLPTGAHLLQPLRIVGDLLDGVTDRRPDVVELDEHVGEPVGESAIRSPTGQRRGSGCEGVACATIARQHFVSGRPGGAVVDGAGQRVLEHLQRRILVRVVDGRGIQLGKLEARQVEFSRPDPLVTAERRQLGVELGDTGPGCAQRSEVDRAKGVEGGTLARRREQVLVGVLAVQVDEIPSPRRRAWWPWQVDRRHTPATALRQGRRG